MTNWKQNINIIYAIYTFSSPIRDNGTECNDFQNPGIKISFSRTQIARNSNDPSMKDPALFYIQIRQLPTE